MNRLSLLMFAALFATGCTRAYSVTMGAQPSLDAHYVVVKTKWNGKMLVFDCLSQPEGKDWKPTCRKVRMETFMGKALDSALKGVRRKDADE